MADPKARLKEMLQKLRAHEFRITPQRMAVLEILSSSDGHPSVENVYDRLKRHFPSTSLATVYKTVTLLKELNEVLELGFPEGSNRYDGKKPFPHPHLICIKCKEIVDSDLTGLADMTHEISTSTGFQIVDHRIDFFGICPACRKNV